MTTFSTGSDLEDEVWGGADGAVRVGDEVSGGVASARGAQYGRRKGGRRGAEWKLLAERKRFVKGVRGTGAEKAVVEQHGDGDREGIAQGSLLFGRGSMQRNATGVDTMESGGRRGRRWDADGDGAQIVLWRA